MSLQECLADCSPNCKYVCPCMPTKVSAYLVCVFQVIYSFVMEILVIILYCNLFPTTPEEFSWSHNETAQILSGKS